MHKKCIVMRCSISAINKALPTARGQWVSAYYNRKEFIYEKAGIVYHREGIMGDYDEFDDIEKLIRFIQTGER